jgi:alpha-glucoside transport system substrate-binding protein
MDSIWADSKLVYGGLSYIGTARWQDAGLNLFEQPQKCQLLLQGSFITAFFPEEVQADLDNQVGVFPLPAIDPDLPSTLEVGGEQYVAFNDRPEVRKFMEFMATPQAAKAWVEAGGALFPYKGQDLSSYKSAIDQSIVSALIDVQAARFDASDAMPSEGNVAFWKGVTDYVGGANTDDVLTEIDAAFPQ